MTPESYIQISDGNAGEQRCSAIKVTDRKFKNENCRRKTDGPCGGTVEGGWAEELKPDDDVHTIVEVITDEGLTGVGSAITSKALVAGSGQAACGRF